MSTAALKSQSSPDEAAERAVAGDDGIRFPLVSGKLLEEPVT